MYQMRLILKQEMTVITEVFVLKWIMKYCEKTSIQVWKRWI